MREIGEIIYQDICGGSVIVPFDKEKWKNVEGVWALYGRKYGETEEKCLNVGKNKNIGAEIGRDINYLYSSVQPLKSGKDYINQFAESCDFKYKKGNVLQYLYATIADRYETLRFVYVWNESNLFWERIIAWAEHALYWRNGRPFLKPREDYYPSYIIRGYQNICGALIVGDYKPKWVQPDNVLDLLMTQTVDKHHENVYEMFKKALSWSEVWAHIDDVYEIEESEADKKAYGVRLSILTKDMLTYDNSVFATARTYYQNGSYISYEAQKGLLSLEYRPYFMSFVGELSSQMYERCLYRAGGWVRACFNDNGGNAIHGVVEMAASPIVLIDAELHIIDFELTVEEIENIEHTYLLPPVYDDKRIENELKRVIDFDFDISRIYRIGNGNLIRLMGQRKELLYDIGHHQNNGRVMNHRKYNTVYRDLNIIEPNAVLISHWDADHYLGVIYAHKKIFSKPWFVPKVDETSGINERRLCCYINLVSGRQLYSIETTGDERTIATISKTDQEFTLFKGNGKGDKNQKNSNGIVITVTSTNNTPSVTSIFQADVKYSSLRYTAWKVTSLYDYLIVPHHGAKMACTQPCKLPPQNDCVAIVCGDNTSGRPDTDHRSDLSSCGYDVCVTEDVKEYYEIDLGNRNRIKTV